MCINNDRFQGERFIFNVFLLPRMDDSKSNDGCISNGIMPKEEELGGIFEEKLYVNKRAPFKESNFLTKEKKNLANWREETNNKELVKGRSPNASINTVVGSYKEGENSKTDANNKRGIPSGVFREGAINIDYFKDRDLYFKKDEIEKLEDSDGDLADAYQTKLYILDQKDKRVTFEDEVGDGSANNKNDANTEKQDELLYKEKYRRLEIEFNRMLKTQKDVLNVKSKLYRFIYSEILAIENKYSSEIDALCKENAMLKKTLSLKDDSSVLLGENQSLKKNNLKLQKEIELRNKEIQSYKEYLKKLQDTLSDKVLKWKVAIELKIREYLSNFRGSRLKS